MREYKAEISSSALSLGMDDITGFLSLQFFRLAGDSTSLRTTEKSVIAYIQLSKK
jgi:hypothetical protein